MPEVIKIDNSSVGLRIDKWIKINLIKIPQSLIEKDLRKGRIKVNNRKVKSSYKLNKLDKIYLFNFSYKNFIKSKKVFVPKDTIIKEAEKNNVKVLYESSVCAGTPIIKLLTEELSANKISKISNSGQNSNKSIKK